MYFVRTQRSGVPVDVMIAARRVETAVCAFGGSIVPADRQNEAQSIFRLRGGAKHKQDYEQRLHERYYLSGSMISWEVSSICRRFVLMRSLRCLTAVVLLP